MAEDRNGRKKFKFGSSCIRRWATSMEEKGRERSTVNSRIDAFLRDPSFEWHKMQLHRSLLSSLSCISPLRSFQRPIPLPSTFRIPVPLSPFLSLSLSLSFLTMNFDKEPFFFTRKAPYFPLPAVPLPVEHLKEAIRGFRGSRRFVTLTLNLTRQEGIWSGKSWSSIKRVYVALWERNFWIYIFFWNKKKVDSLRKKCRNESNHLFVNTHLRFPFRIQRYASSLFLITPSSSRAFHLSVSAPRNFPFVAVNRILSNTSKEVVGQPSTLFVRFREFSTIRRERGGSRLRSRDYFAWKNPVEARAKPGRTPLRQNLSFPLSSALFLFLLFF